MSLYVCLHSEKKRRLTEPFRVLKSSVLYPMSEPLKKGSAQEKRVSTSTSELFFFLRRTFFSRVLTLDTRQNLFESIKILSTSFFFRVDRIKGQKKTQQCQSILESMFFDQFQFFLRGFLTYTVNQQKESHQKRSFLRLTSAFPYTDRFFLYLLL